MKKKITLIGLLLLLFLGILLSLKVGTTSFSWAALSRILQGGGTSAENLVLYDFRLPRLLIALLAGSGLSLAGYVFQTITHNDLADPGILGINAGAGLTVLLYLGFFASGQTSWLLPLVACTGSLFAAFLVYLCGQQFRRLLPNRLLLAGVAVNAGLSALTLIATLKVARDNYTFVTSWLAGTIWGATWQYVGLLLPWLLILVPVLFSQGRTLELLNLGDETAIGLGVALRKKQFFLLLCGVCLAAVSVAVAGSISFIGLIAPHIARTLQPKRNNTTLAFTMLMGALLLTYGDLLGRILLPQGELAAGIVVALVGAPYFIYQLLKTS
ncbi:FecCD family ABC transporter permease [Enterococcus nangangensis]|uniref:FecCD family ABC transporter permease n=1 Tax=Enterococcus nangangensis TaxID=2559926 RepID=UPI0010F8F903|nr:iron ABC transporter permease [Enterococcus nangangensis]